MLDQSQVIGLFALVCKFQEVFWSIFEWSLGMGRFCRQKNWKNRSPKAMSKMLGKMDLKELHFNTLNIEKT